MNSTRPTIRTTLRTGAVVLGGLATGAMGGLAVLTIAAMTAL